MLVNGSWLNFLKKFKINFFYVFELFWCGDIKNIILKLKILF